MGVLVPVAVFLLVLIVLIVLANRSLQRQQGSMLKRTPEEDRLLGHAMVTMSTKGGDSS